MKIRNNICYSKTIFSFILIIILINLIFFSTLNNENDTNLKVQNVYDKKNFFNEIFTNSLEYDSIDGLYYLRGCDQNNILDVGSILRNQSQDCEITRCHSFLLFHFSENGTYVGNYIVENIYFHCWMLHQGPEGEPPPHNIHRFGYSNSSEHNYNMNEWVFVNTDYSHSYVNNFALATTFFETNTEMATFEGDEIYNFTIKTYSSFPRMINSPNQSSFIILNLEDEETLQNFDRDLDGLDDYQELFVYYTNPFDNDTDNDCINDNVEILGGTDPNSYLDFNILGDLDNNGFVEFDDILPFIRALEGEDVFYNFYPNYYCWIAADCNQNGHVDFDDIKSFTRLFDI